MIKVKHTVLTLAAVLLLFTASVPSFASQEASMQQIKEYIVKCAVEMGVEPEIALAIAKKESGFNQSKRSPAGAIGVFQLMPSTARRMGYNPYNYRDNIKGGITYYKNMKKMFNNDALAFAAYNAGPGNVKKFGGIPPFAETKKFVAVCTEYYNYYKKSPDATVSEYLAIYKDNRTKIAEKEKKEVITLYLLNQAI